MKKILSVPLVALMLFGCGVFATAECNHDYTAVEYAATCKDFGYTEYSCNLCGDFYYDNFVETTEHQYGEWELVDDATCTASGLEIRICIVCDAKETHTIPLLSHIDENDDKTCDVCSTDIEPDAGEELSPYEWLKLFFANIIAWFKAIFA